VEIQRPSDAQKRVRAALAIGVQVAQRAALHHMTMIHTPMFFAAVPGTFLDKFIALTPDPVTGKPSPDKFKAFMARHADNTGQASFLRANNPPPSYVHCAFYGIHTFKFIDKEDKGHDGPVSLRAAGLESDSSATPT